MGSRQTDVLSIFLTGSKRITPGNLPPVVESLWRNHKGRDNFQGVIFLPGFSDKVHMMQIYIMHEPDADSLNNEHGNGVNEASSLVYNKSGW